MVIRSRLHDRNDLLHDITAGAAGNISQQILDRSADLCFGVVLSKKFQSSSSDMTRSGRVTHSNTVQTRTEFG
jgi:hypothetical protein